MQKYMSFRVGKQLVFIDSVQFMSSSLDSFVGNLNKDRFLRMQGEWKGKELEMLLKKRVYPYEYMDHWGRFGEKRLPGRSAFYSYKGGTLTPLCRENLEQNRHSQNLNLNSNITINHILQE